MPHLRVSPSGPQPGGSSHLALCCCQAWSLRTLALGAGALALYIPYKWRAPHLLLLSLALTSSPPEGILGKGFPAFLDCAGRKHRT